MSKKDRKSIFWKDSMLIYKFGSIEAFEALLAEIVEKEMSRPRPRPGEEDEILWESVSDPLVYEIHPGWWVAHLVAKRRDLSWVGPTIRKAVHEQVEVARGIKLGTPQPYTIKPDEVPDNPVRIYSVWFPRQGGWGISNAGEAGPLDA